MHCPSCGCRLSVVGMRRLNGIIIRIRLCQKCQTVLRTVEKPTIENQQTNNLAINQHAINRLNQANVVMINQKKRRNPDCKLYAECLQVAAGWNIPLACSGCHLQNNTEGKLSLEKTGPEDCFRCAKLIGEIFFPSPTKERKSKNGTETIIERS